jgi:hypothetical protein
MVMVFLQDLIETPLQKIECYHPSSMGKLVRFAYEFKISNSYI